MSAFDPDARTVRSYGEAPESAQSDHRQRILISDAFVAAEQWLPAAIAFA